ncbi:ABC transporter permease [Pirellulaceae bacterium SH501]
MTVGLWAFVLIVYIFYVPSHVSPLKLPGPAELASAQQQVSWSLIGHAFSTFGRVISGYALGCFLGVSFGFAMFASRWLDAAFFTFIEALRPIPPVGLIPFFILWFKFNPWGPITLIALGCFMVLVVSTTEALRNVPVSLRRAARSLGSKGASYFLQILLPAILPSLIAPLRVALALAISLAVASEFMGAQSGIGFLMMVARRTLHTETILLGVIVLGAMSFLLDTTLRLTLRRFTRWSM